MDKYKDLSDFDKDQIVLAKQIGRIIAITAGLDGCSWYAVVNTYQKSKTSQPVAWAPGSVIHIENKG